MFKIEFTKEVPEAIKETETNTKLIAKEIREGKRINADYFNKILGNYCFKYMWTYHIRENVIGLANSALATVFWLEDFNKEYIGIALVTASNGNTAKVLLNEKAWTTFMTDFITQFQGDMS